MTPAAEPAAIAVDTAAAVRGGRLQAVDTVSAARRWVSTFAANVRLRA